MIFSSTTFCFLFLPAVLLIYYNPFIKNRAFRNVFLLLSSLFFYAWGEPIFVFLMVFSIVVTYFLGVSLECKRRKSVLVVGIVYHLLVLFVFKYLGFIISQISGVVGTEIRVEIGLPIGISFFTFQMMSYLFDVYYKKAEAQENPLYVGLYISFFPQLIAGPIIRYETIAAEIKEREDSLINVTEGMRRFIYGLGKKVLIANYLAQVADNCFSFLGQKSVAMAWYGAIAYTLQIYFDFSGYSDMAIGLGRMFGFHFPENFNYPYISRSITDFWRRWHISLSSWFRDYVYIPLGGNRVSHGKHIRNLFIVWLLTGIWHGANWTFLCWGLIYFVALLIEKMLGISEGKSPWTWISTIIVVILAWVIFRSDSIAEGLTYLGMMFGIGAEGVVDSTFMMYISGTWVIFLVAIIGATPLVKKLLIKTKEVKAMRWFEGVFMLFVFGLSLLKMINSTYNPFLYFNF